MFARIILEKIVSSETVRWGIFHLFPCSGNPYAILKPLHRQSFLPASIPVAIDYISYLLQSLDKQSLLCNCYISALAFSFLQIQHKPSFLLVLIPTQIIFPTCFNPKIGNLRYFCNFSSFSFYSIQ